MSVTTRQLLTTSALLLLTMVMSGSLSIDGQSWQFSILQYKSHKSSINQIISFASHT